MKGNQNYFDENNEKERESIQSSQNAVKKNNIKISLEPTENIHYFNEDTSNSPTKEFDYQKQKNKNNTNTKKSKVANQLEVNEIKTEGIENKLNVQNKINMNFDMQENELIDYEEKNFGNEKKNRNPKSKKSSSNKFSNGILEEVGGSKFIIRTNFLEEDCFLENKDYEEEKSNSNYEDQSIDDQHHNLMNRNGNTNENSEQPKKKKTVIYV